ncbi:MAG: 4Fe-4S binding protein [Beijerinckiaceae bacterium]
MLGLLAISCSSRGVCASTLDRADLERFFPPPLVIGEKDEKLPLWPILKQNGGAYYLFAYAFETIDFASFPGFGGTPADLLIALAPDGSFRDVKVLSQHEPVFVDGLGPGPLAGFVEQYVGLSVRHSIRVGRPGARANGAAAASVVDGISMATASTRIINETILAASLAAAREKLGFGTANTLGLKVRAKADGFEAHDWDSLVTNGLVKRFTLTIDQVDQAFAHTPVASSGTSRPNNPLIEIYIAYLNVPSIGQNILGASGFASLMRELGPGNHAILVLSTGPWNPLGEDFVLGSVPDRIGLAQNNLIVNVRDMAIERRGQGPAGMPPGPWTILKTAEQSGFDPSKPWSLTLKITREKGQILAEKFTREFAVDYALPAGLFVREQTGDLGPSWTDAWRARWIELGIIAAMISCLVPVLVWQKGLAARANLFTFFRFGYLLATLVFIGWYAQAQLSIVTLIGLARAVVTTGDFHFLLYDPPSLVIWAFVLLTLVIWGRGNFCGWLCPFGALQEILAWPAQWLRIPQIVLPLRLDRALRWIKYILLSAILAGAAVSAPVSDKLAEIEPFKTAITLGFVRSPPFVVYAAALLVLNLFIYKGFCRYLCPLGAALAGLGRLRVLNWIPRRAECGNPCQFCKVKCRYDAIEPNGKIVYAECFQCMDCVTIIENPNLCVPQILERKRQPPARPRVEPPESVT